MVATLAPVATLARVKNWFSSTTWGSTSWQQALAALIAAAMFWPQASIDPPVGLDPSWQAGLALARIHHLAWGPEVIYTYGPLGFLQNSGYYSFEQVSLATIYQPIVVAALLLGIAAALRQRHAPMTSLVGAFITTGVVVILHIGHGGAAGLEYPELAVLAAVAWGAVPLLQHNPRRSAVFTICIALGAVAGFQLLVKFNSGVAIVIIALAVSALLDWRAVGRHCATVGVFAVSTLIWWVLAGQRPANLPAWFNYSGALVSGYSEAMAAPFSPYIYLVPTTVLVLAWLAALGVIFVRGGQQIPHRLVALVGLATVIVAKKEFVRLLQGNLYVVLGTIILAVAIVPLSRTWRRVFVTVVLALVLVLLSAQYVSLHMVGDDKRWPAVTAAQAPAQAVDRLTTLAVPGRVNQRVEQAKARQRALYAVPGSFVETIGSQTVHVDPDQTSTVWAYNLTWRPAPVFQTFAAFTPALDSLNSETLAHGPQFVLSRLSPDAPATGLDGRLGVQESPRYSRALLCDYAVTGVQNQWALFTRVRPHCGPLTELSQVAIRGNEVIDVPTPSKPGMAVLAGIDLQPTAVDRSFQGTVVPLTIPTIVLDGVAYRLVAANAVEPFLLTSPPSVDGTNLQVHAHTIGIGRTQSLGQGYVAGRLRFYEMRVEPFTQTVDHPEPPPSATKTVFDAHGTYWPAIDKDGTYLVGVDFWAGKYHSSGGPRCYWARLGSVNPADIIEGNKDSGPQEVVLRATDTAFLTQNCGSWQMLPPV